MTQRIDSSALDETNRILGIQSSSVGRTDLEDGSVSQVLSVNDIVRRSRAQGVTEGWFYAVMQHIHTGAGELAALMNPYAPRGVQGPAYPRDAPQRQRDFWVATASLTRVSGAGDLDGAAMFIDPQPAQLAWGVTNTGVATTDESEFPVARWISGLEETLDIAYGITGDGGATVRLGLRIGRGSRIIFRSQVDAAATINLMMIVGLFPAGLGQDLVT